MKTVLITGASAGIGREFAELFAREGYHLILVARRAQALRKLADSLQREHHISVRTLAKDLSRPETPGEIYRELTEDSIAIDVLVNNAGAGVSGLFKETDLAAELSTIQLNLTALTHLTKVFLLDMVRRGAGKILNVSSTAAFQPGPTMAVYYATKAYVLSFSEALAEELGGTGVTVTCLCPGPTLTEFQARAGISGIRLLKFRTMDAAAVARRGYEGLMKGRALVIPGFFNRLFAWGVRFFPRRLVTRAALWLHQRSERARLLPETASRRSGPRPKPGHIL